jgi:hypothetical protein
MGYLALRGRPGEEEWRICFSAKVKMITNQETLICNYALKEH